MKRVARSFIEDFGSCQNRITTLADGFALDAHLRTDLPKNKPTVSFLKASTAYMALRVSIRTHRERRFASTVNGHSHLIVNAHSHPTVNGFMP